MPKAPAIRITQGDVIYAYQNMKFTFLKPDGSIVKEVKSDVNSLLGIYLDNSNFLLEGMPMPSEKDKKTMVRISSLYDSSFNKIKDLDQIKQPSPLAQRIEGTYHNSVFEVNAGKIFTGNQTRGYEIYVFNLDGNLIRKIRKDYKKVAPSEGYKEKYTKSFLNPQIYEFIKDRLYFPSSLPPFHSFITDNKGRIYVMTYEKGDNAGEYIFDIFNPEGVFISRKSLEDFSTFASLRGLIKNDRFYYIKEKKSGFEKLMVYKMIWE